MSALRRTAPVLLLVGCLAVGSPASQVQAATPTCAGQTATIVGTTRDDRLVGTARRDVIAGRGGDDVIEGLGGNDLVCGGADADVLRGGAGDDALYGNGDRLGSDVAGTFLVGDVLSGGPEDDRLVGGFDDRSAQARRRPDTVSWSDSPRGVVVDLRTGTASGFGADRVAATTRLRVVGSPYGDQITGSVRPDVVSGEGGDDVIAAGDGSDTVFTERSALAPDVTPDDDVVDAGRGDDLVSSQAGRDRVQGRDGDDFLEAYSVEPTTVVAGPGDDYVAHNLVAGSGAETWGGAGVDVVSLFGTLLEGRSPRTEATIDLRTGTTSSDVAPPATGRIGGYERHRLIGNVDWRFHGSPIADRLLIGSGGPLNAWTYDGNDTVTASERADFVNAGAGTDTVWGAGGADTCRSAERGRC
ncbi:MAG TPA: calcium-binding protein [Nocardioides sp.]|nr:calcium-binding protein [Nocardioides sp.]